MCYQDDDYEEIYISVTSKPMSECLPEHYLTFQVCLY